jgi:hypothetical protein
MPFVDAPAYLVVVWLIALALLAGCIAAAIVRAIGPARLGRWLGLDIGEDE